MVEKPLPIEKDRVMIEQANLTVKDTLAAIVELVTNSDDSFKVLEQSGEKRNSPKITIEAQRKTGGQCIMLSVGDNAAGMSKKELLNAIKFGAKTSAFHEEKKVRGFFGRGLKESIIALGEGKIITRKNGEVSSIYIRTNEKKEVVFNDEISISEDDLKESGLDKHDGTKVIITNKNKKLKIPTYPTFKEKLSRHYALRRINQNPDRIIKLIFVDFKTKSPNKNLKSTIEISYEPPKGQLVFDEEIYCNGETVKLEVWESKKQLDFSTTDPSSEAGILVSSEGTILDNKLFGFGGKQAALYFFGELKVPGIAKRLRQGEGLLNSNRTGLDWRESYLRNLKNAVQKELKPLVRKKEKELEGSKLKSTIRDRKFNQKMCKLLSDIADNELEESLSPPINPGRIENLEVRPLFSNIKAGSYRNFTIYIPDWLRQTVPISKIDISSSNPYVSITELAGNLRPHRDYPELHMATFKVEGEKVGESSTILVTLDNYSAQAKVVIVEELGRGKRGKKTKRTSGKNLVQNIRFLDAKDPTQRVYFERDFGELKIFVRFPGVKNYLFPWGSERMSEGGLAILGELVTEGFCRWIAAEHSSAGELLDESIDSFNREYFRLQKKYANQIHRLVIEHYGE